MSAAGLVYALKYEGTKIKLVTSAELVAEFPEALVSFLENQIEFNWPERQPPFNNNVLNNQAYISACTNQGPQGIKYLFSRNDVQFVRVVRSKFAVERFPAHVVEFLESKLDLNDCHDPPNNKVYGTFLLLS